MENNLAFIGESYALKSLLTEIDLSFNRKADIFMLADEGLVALMDRQYPLIIVRDRLAPGEMVLPGHISLEHHQYNLVSAELIKKIRSGGPNKNTPIIVPHLNSPITPLKPYLDAGATECVDIFQRSENNDFANVVRKYIDK